MPLPALRVHTGFKVFSKAFYLSLIFNFHWFISFERQKNTEMDFLSTGSVPKCSQLPRHSLNPHSHAGSRTSLLDPSACLPPAWAGPRNQTRCYTVGSGHLSHEAKSMALISWAHFRKNTPITINTITGPWNFSNEILIWIHLEGKSQP